MGALEPLAEDFDRVLVVVAHPDDVEFGGAAAVARWTGQGRHVAYVMATRGEAGIDTLEPSLAGPLRVDEQVEAAALVGVDDLTFLDHPDGLLEYGIALRRDLTAVIRRVRPELVVLLNHHETILTGARNQADHVVVGRAAIDAVRDAANRWLFPDAGPPWGGVARVAVFAAPEITHAVPVDEVDLERALASLAAHRVYMSSLGEPGARVAPALRALAEQTAQRLPGSRLATGFEVVHP